MRRIGMLLCGLWLIGCTNENGPAAEKEAVNEPAAAPMPVEAAPPPPPTVLDPPLEVTLDTGLAIVEYAVGNGAPATDGSVVSVHYTGWLQDESAADGKGGKFDSSLDRGEPIQFPLGRGSVIKGWDQGILDMRVGGKRTLIIPPDIAYGPSGRPPVIPPNSTLIFDVELMGVQ